MSNNEFSFLEYLNNYSHENLLEIERAAQFKTREELAIFLDMSKDTIKNWFASAESKKWRMPTRQSWNLMLYQLEARRKGFNNLDDLLNKS